MDRLLYLGELNWFKDFLENDSTRMFVCFVKNWSTDTALSNIRFNTDSKQSSFVDVWFLNYF